METPFLITPEENRKMSAWARKTLAGETPVLEHLSADDWKHFIEFARKHGIAPILYHTLKASPPGSLADDSLKELRNDYFRSAYRNMHLYSELGKILRAHQEADIPVIVLKGACLAEAIYGNIALRSMGDVDLLYKKEDMGKAVSILSNLGYSAGYDFQIEDEKGVSMHLPPMKGPKKPAIEAHWTIFDFTHFGPLDEREIGQIWERAKPFVIKGVPVYILAPEDLLLHLCVHISMQHLFDMRLRGFLDLRRVIEFYGDVINWEGIRRRARLWNVDRAARLTLSLAEQWVGLELPDRVKQSWKPDPIDPALMSWIEKKMLGETSYNMKTRVTDLIARESISGKMSVLRQGFFPPRAVLSRIYKVDTASLKIYLCYPVRWLSLFKRFGPTVWNAWRGDVQVVAPVQSENALRRWLVQE